MGGEEWHPSEACSEKSTPGHPQRLRDTHVVGEMMHLVASRTTAGFRGSGKLACPSDHTMRTADHFVLYSPPPSKENAATQSATNSGQDLDFPGGPTG